MTSRQYSPCSMWNRDSPPSLTSERAAGVGRAAAAEQGAEGHDHVHGDQHVGQRGLGLRSSAAVRTLVFWPAQSGQRMPTEVVVMQSGQIGFPQFEQDTPVSRPGWR